MKNQLLIYTLKSNSESRIKGSYYYETNITFKYKTKKELKEAKHSKSIHGYSVHSILTWSQAKECFSPEYLNRLLENNKCLLQNELDKIGRENVVFK